MPPDVPGPGCPRAAPDEPARDVVEALLGSSRALVAVAARSLSDLDLPLPAFRALSVLSVSGPLATTVLADRVGVHQSTMTRTAERLRRRGLVSRRADTADRRVSRVALTPTGEALVARVMERRREVLREVVGRMAPGEPAQVVAVLAAFSRAVTGDEADGPPWPL